MKTKPLGGAFIASQDDLTVIAATRGDALQALAVQVFARILEKKQARPVTVTVTEKATT